MRPLAPLAASPSPSPSPVPTDPPAIETLVKPALYKKLTHDREILKSASLEDVSGSNGLKKYSFYAAMQVNAELPRARRILTDYALYSKLIPYIDKTTYSPIQRILDVEGGIWKWRLRSFVRFDERGDRWIHYRIVGGHFLGLEGDMYFEPDSASKTRGTLVYLSGGMLGRQFPPKLVIEEGAQIVFGFTAGRMRKYLESKEDEVRNENGNSAGNPARNSEVPAPRSHL